MSEDKMSIDEFDKIMAKLKSTYGDKFYLEIRTEFFWQTVRTFSAHWLDKIVVNWIGSNTKPLLVNEIREAAIKEKSRELQNEMNRFQGHQAMPGSIFTTEDVRMMFKMIAKKNAGQIDSDEWEAFSSWVKETAAKSNQNKNIKCLDCFDQGYIWQEKEGTDYMFVFRCDCLVGHSKENYLPIFRNKPRPTTKAIIYE